VLKALGARLHAFAPYSENLTLEPMVRAMGMPIFIAPYEIDEIIVPGNPLRMAGVEIGVAHIPGHALDSVTFHLADQGIVFSGDTLFAESIGRTDLPGGSTTQLLDGIATHLMTLPPETKVFPGHGPSTTIGTEALRNQYLR
jgi:hydroxyacylglutathione hydrolase